LAADGLPVSGELPDECLELLRKGPHVAPAPLRGVLDAHEADDRAREPAVQPSRARGGPGPELVDELLEAHQAPLDACDQRGTACVRGERPRDAQHLAAQPGGVRIDIPRPAVRPLRRIATLAGVDGVERAGLEARRADEATTAP